MVTRMITFKEFIKESKEDPYLYHATYGEYKNSIKKHGLKSDSGNKNYSDSESGKLYLAKDPHVARSYAETSDEVPEHYLDNIVVYKVHKKNLDPSKIHADKNVRDGGDSTVEYHDNIPHKHLRIHSSDD